MAVTTGPVYVENPMPRNQRYGLFNVAVGPLNLPVEARNGGLQFETDVCGLPTGYEVECIGDEAEKEFDGDLQLVVATPFVVRSALTCGAVGLTDERLRRKLMNNLTAGEQSAVEDIFTRETMGASPGLQGATVVTPDCGDMTGALAEIEAAMYDTYGPAGILHVPHEGAAALSGGHLMYRDGNLWKTASGTLVSIGNYANISPAGVAAAAGTAWIYMTGQVAVWRTPDSEVFIPTLGESLDRVTNQVLGQAEREYVVGYECGAFAVNVELCTP